VDWDAFNKQLKLTISTRPAQPIASEEEFQEAAHHLTQSITTTMEVCVPLSKPCPHSKCWWTKRLSTMRQQVKDASKTAYQMHRLPLHPIHNELKTIKEQYANEINTTKKEHWLDWLNDIEGNDLWTANKYISSALSDRGKT
jgi:hypothetical protein